MEETLPKRGRKSSWTDTEDSFRALLAWLDDGEDSEGRAYVEMRRRLVSYFDRKNCAAPDQLADETLNRVSRRLNEEGAIIGETPARYCYITAKFVFLEYSRKSRGTELPIEDAWQRNGHVGAAFETMPENDLKESMLDCLEECAARLNVPERELIFGYYLGKSAEKIKNRRSLAAKLGISPNALAIKAFRIRARLQACVSQCAGLE